jgi:hypothetical protein
MPMELQAIRDHMGLCSVPGSGGSDQRGEIFGKKFPGMGPLGGRTVDAG